LLLFSCSRNNKPIQTAQSEDTVSDEGFEFCSKLKYADGFKISVHDEYKEVVVFDPWKNDTLANYILIPRGKKVPENLPAHDFLLQVPISSIGCLSSPHVGYIGELGEEDKISGAVDAKGIYLESLSEKIANNQIKELGQGMGNNLEVIIEIAPDAVMKTGFDNVRSDDVRMVEAGIPILYCVEWMESSMLARAEWLKFTASFFNQEERADSIFNDIEERYHAVKKLANSVENKPEILLGADFKGTWYMPGGNSYKAELVKDAGADYYYKSDTTKGSLPLSFEVILERQIHADYWIGAKAQTLADLAGVDERYALFDAYKKGNVYHFDKRTNEAGGNDFWESGIVRPDYILMDIVKIVHPELLPDYELYYYRKLN